MDTETRLSIPLPKHVAAEICNLPTVSKAMLLVELAEEVLETIDGFPVLALSATSTQWLKALPTCHRLQTIENLALMLISEVKK